MFLTEIILFGTLIYLLIFSIIVAGIFIKKNYKDKENLLFLLVNLVMVLRAFQGIWQYNSTTIDLFPPIDFIFILFSAFVILELWPKLNFKLSIITLILITAIVINNAFLIFNPFLTVVHVILMDVLNFEYLFLEIKFLIDN